MNAVFGGLAAAFQSITSYSAYVLAIAGLGTLTMAVLEAVKRVTPIRRLMFRREMIKWLTEHAQTGSTVTSRPVNVQQAERELLSLATDGDALAFYSLEIDKLCGQWSAAAQIVLNYPRFYPGLFTCLAARAATEDQVELLYYSMPATSGSGTGTARSTDETLAEADARAGFVDARCRVVNQIQRGIDSFQICVAFRWQRLLQIAAFVVSFAIALFTAGVSTCDQWIPAVVGAFVAAILAPVARDLLAAIQQLRS